MGPHGALRNTSLFRRGSFIKGVVRPMPSFRSFSSNSYSDHSDGGSKPLHRPFSTRPKDGRTSESDIDIDDLRQLIVKQEDMLMQLLIKIERLENGAKKDQVSNGLANEGVVKKVSKNPRGFIDYKRVAEPYRPAKQRVRDWAEINSAGHSNPVEQKKQAARCMDCGTPFCQTHTGCPVNNLIPEWNELVLNDQWKEAIDRLHKTNNFPEFTGRVCPAPCEGACVAGLIDDPVTIKNIEYSIIDRAFKEGWVKPRHVPANARTKKKVAVIGSGPAGLAAADQLNQMGHTVTVFEREDKIGGLLYYGIPNMKLDKSQVDRRVNLLRDEGVTFEVNKHIGVNVDANALQKDFDAIVLCVGSTIPRPLNVPGNDLRGVHYAMDFLTANQKDLVRDEQGNIHNKWGTGVISAEGKNVVVIGGGDTGTDCIGTSLRHYCKSLVNLEIQPTPPSSRDAKANPWPLYPKIYKMDYGHEESRAIFGTDPRKYAVGVTELIGDKQGNVKAVRISRLAKTETGKFEIVPGTEEDLPADLVLLAMGFIGPEETLTKSFGLEKDKNGNVKAEYGKFNTSKPGIFSAGDCRRGQSLVVWAINEGRGAAQEVDKFLKTNVQ